MRSNKTSKEKRKDLIYYISEDIKGIKREMKDGLVLNKNGKVILSTLEKRLKTLKAGKEPRVSKFIEGNLNKDIGKKIKI
jgi:hypothetical protein